MTSTTLFVGHFSFEIGPKNDCWFSLFTMVVEAANREAGIDKFKDLLNTYKENTFLSETNEVYLESMVEILKLPTEGLLGHFESLRYRKGWERLSISLPGVEDTDIALAYGWQDKKQQPTPFMKW